MDRVVLFAILNCIFLCTEVAFGNYAQRFASELSSSNSWYFKKDVTHIWNDLLDKGILVIQCKKENPLGLISFAKLDKTTAHQANDDKNCYFTITTKSSLTLQQVAKLFWTTTKLDFFSMDKAGGKHQTFTIETTKGKSLQFTFQVTGKRNGRQLLIVFKGHGGALNYVQALSLVDGAFGITQKVNSLYSKIGANCVKML